MDSLTARSCYFMSKSFKKVKYTYDFYSLPQISGRFGIYINVPFCQQFCSFCPFYKELASDDKLSCYLELIIQEINMIPYLGTPEWIYYGGGTPNLLSIDQLSKIVNILKIKVNINNMGIELHPSHTNKEYLDGLIQLGFHKVSFGIETLNEAIIKSSHRLDQPYNLISELISYALSLNLFVNVDLMVGLKNQTRESFLEDVERLASLHTSQITIYPFMILRGIKPVYVPDNGIMFDWIEEAQKLLAKVGYARRGPWNFTLSSELYDSSRDELIDDYIGFGPGAFSTYNGYKIVNPVFDLYAVNMQKGELKALVSPTNKKSYYWRQFARMIADLHPHTSKNLPWYINAFIKLLRYKGYISNDHLTPKGIMFAHHLTKTVVESLPFPLQNPGVITNYSEYQQAIQNVSKNSE